MLCEMCQKHPVRVHRTRIELQTSERRESHLCEVCAGLKTEQQLAEEALLRREQSVQRRETCRKLSHLVRQTIIEPQKELFQNKSIFGCGAAMDPAWKLYLTGLGSRQVETNPLEVLFGTVESKKNHVVCQVEDCQVHVIRWDADPARMMNHIFEPFPNAGARLDAEKRELFVEEELALFPNTFRSHTFCTLAAGLLGLVRHARYPERTPLNYRFVPRKSANLSDALPRENNPSD